MKLDEIKAKLETAEYDFLRDNEHLGRNIILLGLGGSHAYGTETETSDLDVRGCALNSKSEILCNENFEQVTDIPTDTTVYSFTKLIQLLTDCNPNTIEILGLDEDQYVIRSALGQQLLDHRSLFLKVRKV